MQSLITNNQQISNQKITLEKRKRYQNYLILNYILTPNTYFDFLSLDTFNIIKNSRHLAQICKSKTIKTEHLLLPLIEINPEIKNTLENLGLTKENAINLAKDHKKQNIFYCIIQRLSKFFFFLTKKKKEKKNFIKMSNEVNTLLEKAIENALVRFKSPIVTTEILFITLIEEKNNMLNKYTLETTGWNLLRYKLLKRIHFFESEIRINLPKNLQFFAYMLQTQIPEQHFNRLISNNILRLGILFFRNRLLAQTRSLKASILFEAEIYRKLISSDNRKYTL